MLYQPTSRELKRIARGTGLILLALLVSVLLMILTRDMAHFLGWAVYLLLLSVRLLAYLFISAAWSGNSGP
jgi:hypothetical protein